MFQKILVPLDGSELAEHVLPYVQLLGNAFQSPVELLRAFSSVPEQWADERQGRYINQFATAFRDEAENYLNHVRTSFLGDLKDAVSVAAHEGDPANLIVTEADKEANTVIAMATHGRSGITRWVMGSVTDKVLHATTTPLLVIRSRDGELPSEEVHLTSVITPLDGSVLAEQILPHVVALAKSLGLTVILVRIAPENRERSRDYLQEVRDELYQQGVFSAEVQVLGGHPAEAIVDLAQETSNNLVAMTTHGRSGMDRWLLGSVTDRVVRHSGGPVLVIRAAPGLH